MDGDLNYNLISRIAAGDILRRVSRKYPSKVALIDGDNKITFKELNERANRFANYLLAKGLQKGDKVAVLGLNSIDFITCYFGVFKAGLVWVPINFGLSAQDIHYIIEHSESQFIFTDQILFPKLGDLPQSPAWQNRIVILEGEVEGCPRFEDCISENTIEPQVLIADRDPVLIMYTSGTTGKPKGVVQSNLGIFTTSLANALELKLSSTDVTTSVLPLFHIAQFILSFSCLNLGGTQVIFRKFDPQQFAEAVAREKINWVFLLPMMYRAIMASPYVKPEQFTSVRFCLYAIAPMDEVSLKKGLEYFKAEFALATGQTEMCPVTLSFKPEYQLVKLGPYWGESSLMIDTEIMDEEGNILGKGEVGEIVHRGPSVMVEYWKNEQETNQTRTFGWHHTGDLGKLDEDGLLIFVDRKKDLIKSGGENVPSILVESVIMAHPKVANAVVVGLPHLRWGEAVTAFVIPKPGENVTKEEIIGHCKERLAKFQVPKDVINVEELPINSSGKIQKFQIRQKYRDHFQEIPQENFLSAST